MTATSPEDELVRALPALRALVDSLAERSPSAAHELLQLDFLVRKYPAAARTSLHLRNPARAAARGGRPAPPEWSPASYADDLPLWRWDGGQIRVATGDMDQLRYLGVALARFDRMTAAELHAYLRG